MRRKLPLINDMDPVWIRQIRPDGAIWCALNVHVIPAKMANASQIQPLPLFHEECAVGFFPVSMKTNLWPVCFVLDQEEKLLGRISGDSY